MNRPSSSFTNQHFRDVLKNGSLVGVPLKKRAYMTSMTPMVKCYLRAKKESRFGATLVPPIFVSRVFPVFLVENKGLEPSTSCMP